MVDSVLNIVNKARRRAKDSPLSSSEYDSGDEADHLQMRGEFEWVYKKVIGAKKDDLRKSFTLTTSQGQKTYSLGFQTNKLSSLELYRIDEFGSDDYLLKYFTEAEVASIYPDLNDIPEGKIQGYFFSVGEKADDISLRFLPTPDSTYTIKGFTNAANCVLTASDVTLCSQEGDDYIEQYLFCKILESIEHAQAQSALQELSQKWTQYLCTNFHLNTQSYEPCISQHSF